MNTLSEIKELLKCNDINVLKVCEKFLDEKIEQERLRGELALRRANIILSTVSAFSAFLVFIAANILDKPAQISSLVILLYAALVLWISRSVWYCLKGIRTQSRYRIEAESIFYVQDKTEFEVLKELLSGKMWELQRSIQPNTERLFFIQRAQRSLVTFVALLIILGVVVMCQNYFCEADSFIVFLLSLILISFWLFGDWIIEKLGIWNH